MWLLNNVVEMSRDEGVRTMVALGQPELEAGTHQCRTVRLSVSSQSLNEHSLHLYSVSYQGLF